MPRTRIRSILTITLVFIAATTVFPVFAKGPDRFVDSDDYKSGDYDKGIIEDYSPMVEGDDIEWYYVAKGVNLSDYEITVGKFKNISKVSSKRMSETLEDGLKEVFDRDKGKKGKLTTENAVYWAERASQGKRWIPYAGGHLAQAGVGVEMIFRNSKGEIVALIRHSGREGSDVEYAAEELIDEIADFVHNH